MLRPPRRFAAGTHGVLRVAHAVRGIGQRETPLRRRELAEALGYWAAAAVKFSRGIVHAFTAGSATRMMLPYLTPEATARSLRYGWQVGAAFYAGLVVAPPADHVDPPAESIDELIDQAIACPDEHGIKITEACLREYRINPKPVYLAAARACTRDLAATGLKLA